MMHFLTLLLIVLCGIFILTFCRKLALAIVLAAITLIPMSSISIGAASFFPARLIILFGILRVLTRQEFIRGSLNKIDKVVILWSVVMIITRILVSRTDVSVIARFGETFDVIGVYFLYRCLIRDKEDVLFVFKTAAIIFSVLTVFMLYEKLTLNNLFSKLGGVLPYPSIRDGKIRCQGPFLHSILAGTVAGTSVPWFIVLYLQKGIKKKFAYIGIVSALSIVVLTSSSGPIMSILLAMFAFFLWSLRNHMKKIQLASLLILILLQFTMESPVWYLISRIDLTGSSTGFHRSELIDSAIRHFSEWWFTGTDYTRHWMVTGVSWSDQHTDITNQYIKNGINGGIVTMFLFIMMIVNGFNLLGTSMMNIDERKIEDKMFLWLLGSTLFSHAITFLSVRYFDQSFSYYFLLLSIIGSMHYYYYVKLENSNVVT